MKGSPGVRATESSYRRKSWFESSCLIASIRLSDEELARDQDSEIFDTQGSAGHSTSKTRFILCSTDKVEPPKSKKVKAGIVASPRSGYDGGVLVMHSLASRTLSSAS